MKTVLPFAAALLAAALAASSPARADDGCLPEIHDAWLRQPPMAMPMLAGFARIENGCGRPLAVVSAHSEAFGSVELHETTVVDGVSRMRAVPRLALAPGASVELKPGGLHLMLMRPAAALAPGDAVPVSLRLEDGRSVEARFEVRAATSR